MRKPALSPDELCVDSFATADAGEDGGTAAPHVVSQGANTCYCTSRLIGCWCTEQC